jgi:hypothetical protein
MGSRPLAVLTQLTLTLNFAAIPLTVSNSLELPILSSLATTNGSQLCGLVDFNIIHLGSSGSTHEEFPARIVTRGFIPILLLTATRPVLSKQKRPLRALHRVSPKLNIPDKDKLTSFVFLKPPRYQSIIPTWRALPGNLPALSNHPIGIGPLRNFSPGLCRGSRFTLVDWNSQFLPFSRK